LKPQEDFSFGFSVIPWLEKSFTMDEIDFFECFSLCELRKDILTKIHKLEQAL
jgi:hypothetical protein